MLSALMDLFRATKRAPIQDTVLGTVRFNSKERLWETSAHSFTIRMGGKNAPDVSLVQHARDVVSSAAEFERQITEFLMREALSFKAGESEILALRLESLNLFWPKRPNDGMIYFDGGHDGRVWRCDYINRKPQSLGFDS